MSKVKLCIITTIDGYIATPDGGLDWLTDSFSEHLGYEYRKFLAEIGTVIMGRQTYRNLLCMDIVWPYKDKVTYIISHSLIGEKSNENIHCITENTIEKIEKMKEGKGSDIGLVGGGVLTKTLLQHDLIDEMIISTVPMLLGGGISLFPSSFPISNWHIEKTELLKNGVMQTTYCKSTP